MLLDFNGARVAYLLLFCYFACIFLFFFMFFFCCLCMSVFQHNADASGLFYGRYRQVLEITQNDR